MKNIVSNSRMKDIKDSNLLYKNQNTSNKYLTSYDNLNFNKKNNPNEKKNNNQENKIMKCKKKVLKI